MPAIVSHYILAEKVMSVLSELRPGLNINRNAFIWGASGPDVLFCHRLLPLNSQRSLRDYGIRMHSEPAEKLLNYLVSYARYKKSDIAMSYALGFVTHYAFDSTAHPFILSRAKQMAEERMLKDESSCHNEIEANLDTLFLLREKGKSIRCFSLSSAAPIDKPVNEAVAEALQGFFLWKYGKRVFRSDLIRAQREWHNALAILNDRTGVKYRFIRRTERIIGISPIASPLIRRNIPPKAQDYANLSHKSWLSKNDGKYYSYSFFELAEQAEDLSIELISDILSGKKLTAEQCKKTFSAK